MGGRRVFGGGGGSGTGWGGVRVDVYKESKFLGKLKKKIGGGGVDGLGGEGRVCGGRVEGGSGSM